MKLLAHVFRPPCSAAVRHQVRLEVILIYVPCLCAVMVALMMQGQDAPFRYRMIITLHIVMALILSAIGIWLWQKDALPSVAHFLEDPNRSNELIVLFAWIPLFGLAAPMLVIGSAQDIADTFLQVLGYLLYLPVLEEPLNVSVAWASYGGLAMARALQLCTSHAGMTVHLTPFLRHILQLELGVFVTMRTRIWYLGRQCSPLTLSSLKDSAEVGPRFDSHRMRRRHVSEVPCIIPEKGLGYAAQMVQDVRGRRELYKAELIGQFIWAVHLHKQKQLNPDVLLRILAFLHETDRPFTSFLGLLDDGMTQVSASHRTTQARSQSLSSMSSIAFLQKVLPLRLQHLFAQPADTGAAGPDDETEASNLTGVSALPWVAAGLGFLLGAITVLQHAGSVW
mmetsp:Transcript_23361/g.55138  ORF Transcript_23361/g.55138 Transcript_23361/m.55138 type:complete len:395 (+) Transcript_23361:46-1230(+)